MGGQKGDFRRRFVRNKLAVSGAIIVLILAVVAVFAPVIAPYDPTEPRYAEQLQPPSWSHLCGTDRIGRDVFSRMVYGSRVSLLVGFVAVGISTLIGLLLGALAGYFGRWLDSLIMRFVDLMLCFPSFFLILAVIAMLPPNIMTIMVVIGLTSWMSVARLVRAEFLSLKERDFVTAARSIGAGDLRIIFRHLLPNALAPVLVNATLGVAAAILIESALSFLGLGAQPPTPTWGNILKDGQALLSTGPWMSVFPGLAILITVMGYNLLGEGIRDALDPRLRE
jgi:peptide/nickel transport system permease protein